MNPEQIRAILEAIATAEGILKSPGGHSPNTRRHAAMVVTAYLAELLALLPARERA